MIGLRGPLAEEPLNDHHATQDSNQFALVGALVMGKTWRLASDDDLGGSVLGGEKSGGRANLILVGTVADHAEVASKEGDRPVPPHHQKSRFHLGPNRKKYQIGHQLVATRFRDGAGMGF